MHTKSTIQLLTQLTQVTNINKTLTIMALVETGYDFSKNVGEQTTKNKYFFKIYN
ncbi:hypothetical protein [Empedobacter brevis]|uniref:hypothetical protein n=1 Tax=Empedobacter brevis TaxID=247 RepID=UPI0028AEA679|nr:hypothetical protein [Empedobacter brevis]